MKLIVFIDIFIKVTYKTTLYHGKKQINNKNIRRLVLFKSSQCRFKKISIFLKKSDMGKMIIWREGVKERERKKGDKMREKKLREQKRRRRGEEKEKRECDSERDKERKGD